MSIILDRNTAIYMRGCDEESHNKIRKIAELQGISVLERFGQYDKRGDWEYLVRDGLDRLCWGFSDTRNVHWKEFLEANSVKQFTKSDLFTGMKVVTRNGSEYTVMLGCKLAAPAYEGKPVDILAGQAHWSFMSLDNYLEDLKNNSNPDYDIVQVSQPVYPGDCLTGDYEVIWQREEKTPQQIKIEELEATIAKAQKQITDLKKENS